MAVDTPEREVFAVGRKAHGTERHPATDLRLRASSFGCRKCWRRRFLAVLIAALGPNMFGSATSEPNATPTPAAVWLFPATYVVHLLEEYFIGGGFPAWAHRALGVQLSDREFVGWNAFALALMCVGALLVSRHPRFGFIEIALAITVSGNAAAHAIGSLVTWTYSPGLITGVLVWIPLGWFRLRSVLRDSSRRARVAGTCIGLFVTIVILTVLMSRLANRISDAF